MCVCVHACVRACVCAGMRAWVRACVRVDECTCVPVPDVCVQTACMCMLAVCNEVSSCAEQFCACVSCNVLPSSDLREQVFRQ